MPSLLFFFLLLLLSVFVPSVYKHIFVVADQVRLNDELTKAFDLQFVCLRERELAKQQRVERIGLIRVYDEDSAKIAAGYGKISEDGRAYLATLSPLSD